MKEYITSLNILLFIEDQLSFINFDFIKCFGVSADNAANIKAASHIHIPCGAQNLNLICKEFIK